MNQILLKFSENPMKLVKTYLFFILELLIIEFLITSH